jgi:hypothetical protein
MTNAALTLLAEAAATTAEPAEIWQIIEREAIREAKEVSASLGLHVRPEEIKPDDLPGGRWHRFETEADVEEWIEANGGEDLKVKDGMRGWYSIPRPVVGSPVSRAFNGDASPEGEIAKVSPTGKKVTTTTGTVFYRKGQTASWVAHGTWSMVAGHQSRRNPHF